MKVRQGEVDAQILEVISTHNRLSGHRILDGCWGWGARMSGNDFDGVNCVDCNKPKATLVFGDGRRCWRCAFWRHVGICPVLKGADSGDG